MAKRLVKIARELNVGTSTIVDFLNRNGFEIDNRPTAKVSDQMYDELLKEFQKSIDIKERARQINIGSRNKKEEESAVSVDIAPVKEPTKEEEVAEETKPTAKEEVITKVETPKIKLKTLGKIDLGQSLQKRANQKVSEQKKKQQTKVQEPEPAPVVEEPKVEQNTTPINPSEETPATIATENKAAETKTDSVADKKEAMPTSQKQETVAPEVPQEKLPENTENSETPPLPENEEEGGEQPRQGVYRKKAPELRGLKILGKIDTQKFERPKKKKKKEKEATPPKKDGKRVPANNNADNNKAGNSEDNNRERRRKPRDFDRPRQSGGDNRSGNPRHRTSSRPQEGGNNDNRAKDPKKEGTSQGNQSGNEPQRKKRKRKKITVDNSKTQNRNTVGTPRARNHEGNRSHRRRNAPRREEVKEVSQKEIEEKIKATMARLQGGGKKRRQKLQRDKRDRLKEKQEQIEAQKETGKLEVTEFISVSELAGIMNVGVTDVITTCMNLGIIVSINQRLDAEVIELVADEFDFEVSFINAEEQVTGEEEEEIIDDPEDLEPRNPIVTVMGHVDHGKTSLLDYIRSANVASGEAGGITQHIGAYEVKTESGQGVTFLDTPGHEAFTAMRARGAKVTDIAIIIIAADDNVMPQTREAISHAQAAGVPMVFAINKIDKPGAQPERIKQELASMNYLVEEWGGSYQSQDISAKNGTGIEELLEKVLLESEILELKANPKRKALGTVIEASLEKGRGYVTKVLIQNGTLGIGDPIVAGEYAGKIRAMLNERGKRIKSAGPSKPVMILGLSGAPQAGEVLKEMDTEQDAKALATKRSQISREQANRATKRISLDEIGRRLALGTFKELNLIVKGDVDGSVEALSDSLIKLSVETVQVNVIHKAVGQIIESDILLASASDAIVIGFQVRPSLNARRLAEKEGVQIKTYSIIYETIEEIKLAIEGLLEPTKEEKIVAEVEVRNTFKISKVGTVAGGFVKDGKINKNNHIRLIRDGIVTYPTKEGVHGKLASLKRFKDDVKEVKNGMECGLSVENYNDIKVGDIIEAYEIIEIKQTLESIKR